MKIIGVRFKSVGKVYYFNPKGVKVNMGDKVIVETVKGVECGEAVLIDREINPDNYGNIKPIIRVATEADLKQIEKNK